MKHVLISLIALSLHIAPASAQDLVGVGDAPQERSTSSAASRPTSRESREARTARKNPFNVVDLLEHTDTADAWSAGTLANANVVPDGPARVVLGFRERGYPREGSWTGPEVKTKFDFTDLIASFNPHTPPDTGATLEVRVQQGGTWSPWLFMQSWGRVIFPPQRTIKFDGDSGGGGEIDIDQLILRNPAQAYQMRIGLIGFGFDVKVAPSVRRLSVCYSGVVDDAKQREELTPKPTTLPANFAKDLNVPFRGQGAYENPRSLWGLTCSPTSTSMVMNFFGVKFTTLENCEAIYDPQYGMFGNWGRAVSRAGEVGLDAWLARFRNWDQVKAEIAQGNPVIASIRFRSGEVKGFLYKSTGGHLLVVRGFKENGDVIVNDPSSRDKGNGPVYPAAEFAKAWFDNGGVGYVIRKPAKAIPPALVNVPAGSPATMPATAPVATTR
ncbi:MAG: C39 family peptidase [Tepidisphaeraceae bacterium]